MDIKGKKVLVVGCGLAGICAGISLARVGALVRVIDREEQPVGALITITNRAINALDDLGVLDDCRRLGRVPPGGSIFTEMWDSAGNPVQMPEVPHDPAGRLPASVSIYRPTLADLLREKARGLGVEFRTGIGFESMSVVDGGVDVAFDDGTNEHFDLLVGADGTRSSVRSQLFPEIEPIYTGFMSFRIMLDDGPEGPVGFYMLPNTDIVVTNRLPDNRLYVFLQERMEPRRVSQEEGLEILDRKLGLFKAPFLQKLRARLADNPTVIARPYEALLKQRPWHHGPVILIGDAVHSTTANLASGGSIAIEDGMVLGEELAKDGSLKDKFEAFEERRYPRVSLVVETSLELLRLHEEGKVSSVEIAQLRSAALAELMKPY